MVMFNTSFQGFASFFKILFGFQNKPGYLHCTLLFDMLLIITVCLLLHCTHQYCTDRKRFGVKRHGLQCEELIPALREDANATDLQALCQDKHAMQACPWTCNSCHIRPGTLQRMSLNLHNKLRNLHSAGALSWKENLAHSATQHCRMLAGLNWDEEGIAKNAGHNVFHGLNIKQVDHIAGFAVRQWYREAPNYDYTQHVFTHAAAEFTLMVWKSVRSLGCGYAKYQRFSKLTGVQNHVVFCCHYSPAGNFKDRFEDNVMEPKRQISY